jgi:hypothetical protein
MEEKVVERKTKRSGRTVGGKMIKSYYLCYRRCATVSALGTNEYCDLNLLASEFYI